MIVFVYAVGSINIIILFYRMRIFSATDPEDPAAYANRMPGEKSNIPDVRDIRITGNSYAYPKIHPTKDKKNNLRR